jgi:hypothetical protein
MCPRYTQINHHNHFDDYVKYIDKEIDPKIDVIVILE